MLHDLSLIIAILNRGAADKVVRAAKEAGAPAATIFFARGAGIKEAHTFFGLAMDPAREIILFLVEDAKREPVMDAIHVAGEFDKPGTGIALTLKVTGSTGLESQIEKLGG